MQSAPNDPDVVEVKLSSFAVKSPRRFGDCWAATQLWADLGLHTFWRDALAADAGEVPPFLFCVPGVLLPLITRPD